MMFFKVSFQHKINIQMDFLHSYTKIDKHVARDYFLIEF